MRAVWPANGRCRCVFRRPIGSKAASPATTRSRSRARLRPQAPISSTFRPGQTSPDAKPVYGRMFQTPYADQDSQRGRHRDDGGRQHHRSRSGQRDLRRRPGRPRRARAAAPRRSVLDAARRGAARVCRAPWPVQYVPGKQQLERLIARAKEGVACPNDSIIAGKHAVVTGGARGIGLAIATALAAAGAKVSVVSRSALAAADAGQFFRAEADVTDEAADRRAFDSVSRARTARSRFSSTTRASPSRRRSRAPDVAMWDRSIATNLDGNVSLHARGAPRHGHRQVGPDRQHRAHRRAGGRAYSQPTARASTA